MEKLNYFNLSLRFVASATNNYIKSHGTIKFNKKVVDVPTGYFDEELGEYTTTCKVNM